MAIKKRKLEIKMAQLKKMFKQHKIRESRVDLVHLCIGMYIYFFLHKFHRKKGNINYKTFKFFVTGCPVFKKAIFRELGIRECFVRLDHLIASKESVSLKKKLVPSEGKLRSQVSWLFKFICSVDEFF